MSTSTRAAVNARCERSVCYARGRRVCVCVYVFETYERVIWLIADPVTDGFFLLLFWFDGYLFPPLCLSETKRFHYKNN